MVHIYFVAFVILLYLLCTLCVRTYFFETSLFEARGSLTTAGTFVSYNTPTRAYNNNMIYIDIYVYYNMRVKTECNNSKLHPSTLRVSKRVGPNENASLRWAASNKLYI